MEDESVGIVGPWGLTTDDIHHFHDEVESGDADAMQAYCMAMRRGLVNEVGLMREVFRFYRNLDLDFSFHVKDRGYRIVADGGIPLVRHEHRQWECVGRGGTKPPGASRTSRSFSKNGGTGPTSLYAIKPFRPPSRNEESMPVYRRLAPYPSCGRPIIVHASNNTLHRDLCVKQQYPRLLLGSPPAQHGCFVNLS